MGRHTDPAVVTRRAAVATLTASALLVAAGVAVLVKSGGMGWPGHTPGPTASTPPSSEEPEPSRTAPTNTPTALPTATPTTPLAVVTAADARAVPSPRASARQAPAPAPSPRPSPPERGGAGNGGLVNDVVNLVNIERARAGCRPLVISASLQRAAQAHSADMAENDQLSHDGSNGESFVSRLRAAGYRGGPVGENIAAGPSSAKAVMTIWMGSRADRDNILDCRFTAIGVGRASSGSSGSYWTQDFGG
ncbi:CAP domain-containing protein [Monashia sp. NPDC004114]